MNYFVTAIDTDSGKTFFSSILTEYLNADYWKPVQSGNPRDTDTVSSLVSNNKTRFHKETYFLNTPASPHASAKIDGVEIDLQKFKLPARENENLVIEGAGGIMVPLNDDDYVIDLAKKFDCEIVVVSNLYLGSINHTLLSLDYLNRRNFRVKGIVFNGEPNPESESIILSKYNTPCLLRIQKEIQVSKNVVLKYAKELKKTWN